MFQKLRIRLTMFNVLVMVVLLALVALAAFLGSPVNDATSVNQNMLEFALTGEANEPGIDSYQNRRGKLARIQMNESGQMAAVVGKIELSKEEYQTLVNQILVLEENSGMVRLNNKDDYIYLRIILNETSGPVIVLQEVISTTDSFLSFILRIGPILVIVLVLIFFASLFMTERSLIPIRKAWNKQMEFTSDASHELRTPLAVIQTNLECATDCSTETIEENEVWFCNIKMELNRMTKLVNDLLILSRSDNGQKVINKTTVYLEELIEEIINAMLPYAKKKNITLQSHIQSGLMMNGDKELLKRLLIILIDNGIKYTKEGTVTVTVKHSESDTLIQVSDTGIGIAKENMDKIFDRFYRVDEARCSEVEGTGLGLAIAKWIVTEHKGVLTVNSRVGEGTEMMVKIPD